MREVERLRQMHGLCVEELLQLNNNVDRFTTLMTNMINLFEKNFQGSNSNGTLVLIAYDKIVTNLTSVMDLARKFNLQLKIKNIDDNAESKLFDILQHDLHYDIKTCSNTLHSTIDNTAFKMDSIEQGIVAQTLDPIMNGTTESYTANTLRPDSQNRKSYQLSILPAEENNEHSYESETNEDNTHIPVKNLSLYEEGSALETNENNTLLPLKDLSLYEVGSIITASVTHIQDPKSLSFFIIDRDCADVRTILDMSRMKNLRQYTSLPPKDVVFGLLIDDMICRAVHKTSEFPVKTSDAERLQTVVLIDLGDVVEISASKNIMYYLPRELQNISPQAILCQLHGYNDEEKDELYVRLKKLDYAPVLFRVERVIDRTVLARFNDKNQTETPMKKKNTNPFVDTSDDILQEPTSSEYQPWSDFPKEEKCTTTTNVLDAWFNEPKEFIPAAKQYLKKNKDPQTGLTAAWLNGPKELVPLTRPPLIAHPETSFNGLTADEMAMLYEEPNCTSNAMKAVIGYDPQDDKRLCRFYDANTGGCFKGNNCRHEHTPAEPDGWTKDVLPAATIIDNRQPPIRYPTETILSIVPTYVGHFEYFYGQVVDPNQQMEPLIWKDDDVVNFKRYTAPPFVFSIVLAKYDDGFWYRAKVIEVVGRDMVKVFYVDYGNSQTVRLMDLLRCDVDIQAIPFQALLFRLADVRETKVETYLRKEAIQCLCNWILNKEVNVKVVNHYEDLLVRFLDQDLQNVLQEIAKVGCVKPFNSK